MTITRTFPLWRGAAAVELWIPAGTRHKVVFVARGPEMSWSADWYDSPLDLDAFNTGASDYDTPADELYCPCGATLPGWDGNVATALRMIFDHCAKAGHPKPRFEP